jgi:hypothetical protein
VLHSSAFYRTGRLLHCNLPHPSAETNNFDSTCYPSMPLPPPNSPRKLKHRRAIEAAAYERDDGLWDIDARITDIKTREVTLASGSRPAGNPLHDLWLRITIDRQLNIVEACAASDAVPYSGYCDTIGPAYCQLIGLNLMRGFRHAIKERLAGTAGCTHLTELAQILPTAAIQAFAGEVLPTRDGAAEATPGDDQKPFQLDRCHALRTGGEAVARYYPRWAVETTSDCLSS